MVSLVFHMFLYGTGQPFIFWAEEGVGGGGGLAKEKQNHTQEKKEKKLVHKEAWQNGYASLTYFWHLYINRNVRKEVLTFLILFEWKVLNRHNFDLPGINQYCSHCRISVNLQWKDFQDKKRPGSTQFVLAMSISNACSSKCSVA